MGWDSLIDNLFKDKITALCVTHRNILNAESRAIYNREMKINYRKVKQLIRRGFLKQWLWASLSEEDAFDVSNFECIYYPAKKYHEKEFFDDEEAYKKFYCDCHRELWEYFKKQSSSISPITSFEVLIKMCQISNKRIDATALLVDESQDLTPAQVSWMYSQATMYGTHVYFVGDAVQSIYGFRGASAASLFEKDDESDIYVQDFKLTESFRFDKNVGNIANIILACKRYSPQTIGQTKKQWIPYWVDGIARWCSEVTCEGNIQNFTNNYTRQATLLATTNMELFGACLKLLGSNIELHPKISLYSSGKTSGVAAWRNDEKKLKDLMKIYLEGSGHFGYYPFHDDRYVTWEAIERESRNNNSPILKYVSMIKKFKDRTMEMYDYFKENVLDKKYNPEDADLILSTIHSAKGDWAL